MKRTKDYLEDITEIRNIMERSANFISLSGLSGILVGIYALIGSFVAHNILYSSQVGSAAQDIGHPSVIFKLAIVAVVVLVISISTGIFLTLRKNKPANIKLSGTGFRELLINLTVPLVTGGLFTVLITYHGYYDLISTSLLSFYGITLVSASKYTLRDIKYLGMAEIISGMLSGIFPDQGLIFWAFGFGVLHIIYGTWMYYKYEK